MSEKLYRAIKSQVRAVHDELEDWIFEAFREGGLPECESDEEQDLKEEVAQRRRGMRYFAAGRPRDRKQFASMLFPRSFKAIQMNNCTRRLFTTSCELQGRP
ncbi:unnamed protein product [Effrenium voratum]|uniref:Uncharacterized protein n=1 Tax=Effrenium voratum TaxID=2562239 RepID=A0AA36HQU7_9DINO|nr:unnamed protein product [Effrenium voratum]